MDILLQWKKNVKKNKIKKSWLPVSSPACKELEVITLSWQQGEMLNKLKNRQLFLDL